MTGSEFYDYVLETFKRTDKSTEVYNAINDAVQTITQTYPFEDYKTASATATIPVLGDYSFALASDYDTLIGEIVMVDSDWSKQMTQISRARFQQLYQNNATDPSTGWPEHYCVYGGNVYVGPVPDKTTITYTYDYSFKADTVITSVTANVPFTALNRAMLKAFVLGTLYRDLEQFDLSDKHMIYFQTQYDILVDKEEKNTRPFSAVNYNDN